MGQHTGIEVQILNVTSSFFGISTIRILINFRRNVNKLENLSNFKIF